MSDKHKEELMSFAVTLEVEVVARTKVEAMLQTAEALRKAVENPQTLAQVLLNVQEKVRAKVEPVPAGDGPPEWN